jgi:hypothetical protein
MGTQWNGEQSKRQIQKLATRRLQVFAQAVVEHTQRELGVSFPPASRPGQFPRKRTGLLQRTVFVGPVMETSNSTRVGVYYGVDYGEYLLRRGRKGPADVVKLLAPQYAAITAGVTA